MADAPARRVSGFPPRTALVLALAGPLLTFVALRLSWSARRARREHASARDGSASPRGGARGAPPVRVVFDPTERSYQAGARRTTSACSSSRIFSALPPATARFDPGSRSDWGCIATGDDGLAAILHPTPASCRDPPDDGDGAVDRHPPIAPRPAVPDRSTGGLPLATATRARRAPPAEASPSSGVMVAMAVLA
jgi:hypothetical protein